MKFTMPMVQPKAREIPVFIPSWVKAVNAEVCISDLSKPLNISTKPTNIVSGFSLKELQKSRMLKTALKMGVVVEVKNIL
jgi:hypothetical protein